MNKFHTATYQANLLYGIEIPPEDAEEIGLIAYNHIGNKRYKLYRYCTKVNCQTLSIDLPCNCREIEAITYDFEDWNYNTDNLITELFAGGAIIKPLSTGLITITKP